MLRALVPLRNVCHFRTYIFYGCDLRLWALNILSHLFPKYINDIIVSHTVFSASLIVYRVVLPVELRTAIVVDCKICEILYQHSHGL